ncbi:hypothetical protein BLOT_013027 [Blomia tropicalis]|nr:hypothetical protein BLOT_013027 [Blomia tropicalis]
MILSIFTTSIVTINLQEDRKFVYNFFRFFNQVRSQLSEQCKTISNYVQNNSNETWIAQMIDANSLLEPGTGDGNIQFLGSYDECIQIRVPQSVRSQLPSLNNPLYDSIQYCTLAFNMSIILNQQEIEKYPKSIIPLLSATAGICIPSACTSESDIPIILSRYSEITNNYVRLDNCVTGDQLAFSKRAGTGHIIIIVIIVVIIAFCFIGTVIEFTIWQTKYTNWYNRLFLCFSWKRNFEILARTTSNNVKLKKLAPTVIPEAINDVKPSSSTSAINVSQEALQSGEVNYGATKPKLVRPQITCFDGIRFISFSFILTYHTFTAAQQPSSNLLDVIKAETGFINQLVTNAALWVDTFFLLSGFLVAHSVLYQRRNSDYKVWHQIWSHPKRLLHRYLRLTPSIAGVLMLSILIEVFGSGPLWNEYVVLSKSTCHKNWWLLFLYVNNIFRLNQPMSYPSECLAYLWYVAVDMQFYVISPLLIMFLTSQKSRTRLFGVAINLIVTILSWIITGILMNRDGLTPTVLVTIYDLDYINLIYKQPHCRIGPYCVGILLAYILYRRTIEKNEQNEESADLNAKPNQWFGLLLLSISITIILTITLLTYPWLLGDKTYHDFGGLLYGMVHRTFWAIGWAIFIYVCVIGYAEPLNRFLSTGIFQILSKLTYQSYLVHSILISAITHMVRQKFYYSELNLVLEIFQYLLLTIAVSIGTFVTFERPFINLEMTFLKF